MKTNLPTFLVVGAAKSGTTSLFHYLNQHPDIFIPNRKEGRFFSQMHGGFVGPGASYQNDIIYDIRAYRNLYAGSNEFAKGDISNDYLFYHRRSTKSIIRYLGENVKIIIILRNPIERAYSHYLQHIVEGWEKLSFEKALQAEKYRKEAGWAWPFYYKEVGLFYSQVNDFVSHFKNVKVLLFEDFLETKQMLKNVFDFIGVSSTFSVSTTRKFNVSGTPKNMFLHNLINMCSRLRPLIIAATRGWVAEEKLYRVFTTVRSLNLRKKPMNFQTRISLAKYYRDDVAKLQKVIDRNVTQWVE